MGAPPQTKKGASMIKRPHNELGAWGILWLLLKSITLRVPGPPKIGFQGPNIITLRATSELLVLKRAKYLE